MTDIIASPRELLGTLNDVEEKNAPDILFLRGDPELLSIGPRVSVVGSRKPSVASRARAMQYARALAHGGAVVVSGLAEGIDAAAHSGAIESGGRTIAVIGTPLNQYYPAKNRALQDQIARDHLLVSQFRSGSPIQKKNFPMRNRTMALLSDATLIVEAGESSGTLHQGWEALRLGRLLFIDAAVVNSALTWPQEMVRYGAQVLTLEGVEALLQDLPQTAGVGELPF
jgi:DNA processing protein